jgi:hypothetical protein
MAMRHSDLSTTATYIVTRKDEVARAHSLLEGSMAMARAEGGAS